jgi:hypothetical protein
MGYCRLTSARRRRMVKLVNFSSNSYYIILAVVFLFLCAILSEMHADICLVFPGTLDITSANLPDHSQ